MDGYDVQRYQYLTTFTLPRLKMTIMPIGESIELKSGKDCLGRFPNIDCVIHFLQGYDVGYAKGEIDGCIECEKYKETL